MELIVNLRLGAKEVSRHGDEVIPGQFVGAAQRIIRATDAGQVRSIPVSLLRDEGAEAIKVNRDTAGDGSARFS